MFLFKTILLWPYRQNFRPVCHLLALSYWHDPTILAWSYTTPIKQYAIKQRRNLPIWFSDLLVSCLVGLDSDLWDQGERTWQGEILQGVVDDVVFMNVVLIASMEAMAIPFRVGKGFRYSYIWVSLWLNQWVKDKMINKGASLK